MMTQLEQDISVGSMANVAEIGRADGPHPVDLHVGVRIRMRRKEMGVSQERLADALGITFQQVQKYERGANRVSASKLWEIATALTTPVAYFYDGLGDRQAATAERDAAQEFILSTEGIALMTAFPRIVEPAIRQKLVELIRVVAEEG